VAALVASQDFVVELDYGQFYLHTARNEAELPLAVLERAQDGDGIAQDGGLVVILSPHQNNFDMPLRVEVWDSAPPDDLEEWEEAFEAHLDVNQYGLVFESPTLDFIDLAVPPGSYYALITGRGFVAHGWPGSTEPGDHWRLRLWPSGGPARAGRLRAYPPSAEPARAVHLTAGRAAAARINRDLVAGPGARPLGEQTGVARASWTYRAAASKLFDVAADLSRWSSAMGSNGPVAVGEGYLLSHNEIDSEIFDGLPTGRQWPYIGPYCAHELRGRYLDLSRPSLITTELQWYLVSDVDGQRRQTAALERPTILHTRLRESLASDGAPQTAITVEHTELPVAWIEDFTDVWRCKLEAGSRTYSIDQ
jgi:hypothetical protein